MKLKSLITAILLLFVAVSVIYLVVKESNKDTLPDELTAEAENVLERNE